jgi:outer membrane protein
VQQRIQNVILLILVGATLFILLRPSSPKIAYIDSVRLLDQYRGMLDAKKGYAQKAAKWQSSIDTLSYEVKKSISDYERALAAGTAKEKELAKQLIRVKQKQLVIYQKYLHKTAQDENTKETQLVLKQVNEFLNKYGKQHKFDIVFIANQSSNIAYADSMLDITDKVLIDLNSNYRK